MRDRCQCFLTQPGTPACGAHGVTAWTEAAPLAGEGKKEIVAAAWTTEAGHSATQVVAGKELLNGGIHDVAKGTIRSLRAALVSSLEVPVASGKEEEERRGERIAGAVKLGTQITGVNRARGGPPGYGVGHGKAPNPSSAAVGERIYCTSQIFEADSIRSKRAQTTARVQGFWAGIPLDWNRAMEGRSDKSPLCASTLDCWRARLDLSRGIERRSCHCSPCPRSQRFADMPRRSGGRHFRRPRECPRINPSANTTMSEIVEVSTRLWQARGHGEGG
jgi:hypothetical protein